MVQADGPRKEAILSHLVGTSIHLAGKRSGVGDWVVRRVLKGRVMGEVPMEVALEGVSQVVPGIDEHSFRGQKMRITMTALAPLRRLLANLPGDRLATLRRDWQGIPKEMKTRIGGVCIDMKKAWWLELMRQLPHAKVVVDRFHGIQDTNRRVEEARKVEKEVTRRPIPRWPLLKKQEELRAVSSS